MTTNRQYGVLLPHFGSQASRDRLIQGARTAERYGFDSLWVRDHIVYRPHEHEDQNATYVDPFVTLSMIAGVTEHIRLGTACLIPHRHPILSAMMLASLDFVAGPGRVIAGWGIGNYGHEFEAIGIGDWDRRRLIEEQVEIMRCLWRGEAVDHKGEFYEFNGVQIAPMSTSGSQIPIWYGGTSRAAVRRAVEYCDGWIASRMPRRKFTELRQRMERLALKADKPLPVAAVSPYVVPARTLEEGLQHINLPALLDESSMLYGESFATYDDLDGAAIVGPPSVIAEEVRKSQDLGVQHFVFDLRPVFDHFEEGLILLGEEVLPELRAKVSGGRSV